MEKAGVEHILIDRGEGVVDKVKDIIPEGVAGVVEFVGIEKTIKDSLLCTAPKGTVCMVGFLGNRWDYKFFPWMPSTVNLTIYSSETIHADKQTKILQEVVENVENGFYAPNIFKIFSFDEVPQAHDMMEKNLASGKLVIFLDN